eukprot:8726516-Pyramimonas_sp.AAC.1
MCSKDVSHCRTIDTSQFNPSTCQKARRQARLAAMSSNDMWRTVTLTRQRVLQMKVGMSQTSQTFPKSIRRHPGAGHTCILSREVVYLDAQGRFVPGH